MPKPKTDQTKAAPLPKAVRRADASPIADSAKGPDGGNGAHNPSPAPRIPPPNARVVKPAYRTGTVSPREVRAAIKRLRAKAEIA